MPFMLYVDFGRGQTSGGNCWPTDGGEPGLRMAVLVIDPDNPGDPDDPDNSDPDNPDPDNPVTDPDNSDPDNTDPDNPVTDPDNSDPDNTDLNNTIADQDNSDPDSPAADPDNRDPVNPDVDDQGILNNNIIIMPWVLNGPYAKFLNRAHLFFKKGGWGPNIHNM